MKLRTSTALSILACLVGLVVIISGGSKLIQKWDQQAKAEESRRNEEKLNLQRVADTKAICQKAIDEEQYAIQLREGVLRDAWGNIILQVEHKGALPYHEALSAGKDGKHGTKDDISVPSGRSLDLRAAGTSLGKGAIDLGVGGAKGVMEGIKKHWSGEDKKE